MDAVIGLDSENCGTSMKITGENVIKSSKIGSAQRKKLADISNLNQKPILQKQDTKLQSRLLVTNEYVEKLNKENMMLTKLLAERNHIIEISGIELQKLRTNFQKLQQQNMQLAQANSLMLAELNSGKDRLKVLQHELGCKNSILISRNLDLERSKKAETCQTGEVGTTECDDGKEESMHANKDNKPCKTNRRRQSKRESFDSSVIQPDVQKVDGKRPCLRRQSARFKTEELVAKEDKLEIENTNFTAASQCKEIVHEVGTTECDGAEETMLANKDNRPCKTNRRRQSRRESFCPAVVQPDLQKVEDKRLCLRRQSVRFEEPRTKEDEIEIENSNFTAASQCKKIVSTPAISPAEREGDGNAIATHKSESQECRRSSVGRPLRRAVERIQSYKEIPVNVKMRRAE